MLSSPKGNDFVVMFNDNFLYKSIKERYNDYFNQKNFVFQNLTDYINATVIGVNLQAMKGDTNNTQLKGGNTYTHRSGLPSKNKINKTIKITFQLKRGFLNWFIMNDMLSQYVDGVNGKTGSELTGDDVYLPPISIFLLDDDGLIVFERILKNVVIVGMDDLNLQKTDNKISKKEFSVTFAYSEWNNKYNVTEKINIIKPEYVY